MAQFGAVYQDDHLIIDGVTIARREKWGTIGPRYRIQAILPRTLSDRIAEERFRHPVYQIEFEGQTEDYFVAGNAIPISANSSLLRQDFLSLHLSSRYKSG